MRMCERKGSVGRQWAGMLMDRQGGKRVCFEYDAMGAGDTIFSFVGVVCDDYGCIVL